MGHNRAAVQFQEQLIDIWPHASAFTSRHDDRGSHVVQSKVWSLKSKVENFRVMVSAENAKQPYTDLQLPSQTPEGEWRSFSIFRLVFRGKTQILPWDTRSIAAART